MAQGVMRGRVTRVEASGKPWVECADLGVGEEFGPCDVVGTLAGFAPGQRVLVTRVGGTSDDLVVIGRMDSAPESSVPTSRLLTAGLGLQGGGDLTQDRSFTVDFAASGEVSATKVVRADDQRLLPPLPPGVGMEWYTNAAPSGWLMQDGGEYAIATYTALYNVLTANGTVFPYGANTNGSGGAGSTHFRTPNRKGRVGVGRDASQTEFDVLGETNSMTTKTHTITTGELPSHTHVQDSHNHTQNSHGHSQTGGQSANHNHGAGGLSTVRETRSIIQIIADNHNQYTGLGGWHAISGWNNDPSQGIQGTSAIEGQTHTHTVNAVTATNVAATATNQSAGGGGAHNNLQPYIVVNFIIKT